MDLSSKYRVQKGFTLLELLIVISIIAILSIALILALNPAETLKKARDTQRISDLATLKAALGIYTASVKRPTLGESGANATCKTGSQEGSYAEGDKIAYSYPSTAPGAVITDTTLDGAASLAALQASNENLMQVDGTGWLPIQLASISDGSPLPALPIDPVNAVAMPGAVTHTDLVYRYACNATSMTYELAAVLESEEFTLRDNKMAKDGGNNPSYYEVGTNLKILGTGLDF